MAEVVRGWWRWKGGGRSEKGEMGGDKRGCGEGFKVNKAMSLDHKETRSKHPRFFLNPINPSTLFFPI